jgi:dTDP-4-amino-4,6-dideoxygalactose transaminase
MHLQPIFEKYPYYGENISEQLFENGLCLPSGSNMSESDKKRISDALKSFFSTF